MFLLALDISNISGCILILYWDNRYFYIQWKKVILKGQYIPFLFTKIIWKYIESLMNVKSYGLIAFQFWSFIPCCLWGRISFQPVSSMLNYMRWSPTRELTHQRGKKSKLRQYNVLRKYKPLWQNKHFVSIQHKVRPIQERSKTSPT